MIIKPPVVTGPKESHQLIHLQFNPLKMERKVLLRIRPDGSFRPWFGADRRRLRNANGDLFQPQRSRLPACASLPNVDVLFERLRDHQFRAIYVDGQPVGYDHMCVSCVSKRVWRFHIPHSCFNGNDSPLPPLPWRSLVKRGGGVPLLGPTVGNSRPDSRFIPFCIRFPLLFRIG